MGTFGWVPEGLVYGGDIICPLLDGAIGGEVRDCIGWHHAHGSKTLEDGGISGAMVVSSMPASSSSEARPKYAALLKAMQSAVRERVAVTPIEAAPPAYRAG